MHALVSIRFISGSMHYSRVPSFYWRDRLEKMAAAGLNAVQTYVPWNFHETDDGITQFDVNKNVVKFIQTAQDVGLLVILRPGPYICAEWDMGGLPSWLLTNRSMVLRSSDPTYLMYVDRWFSVLLPMMKPLLYENGGPIITVQVENEYGSYYTCDKEYLSHLHATFRKYLGDNVVLFTTDGDSESYLKCGSDPSLFYATVDFGITSDPTKNFQAQRSVEPHGPLVNSEFYTGWLDHWGQSHSRRDMKQVADSLDAILKLNANVNMYMFIGGTNFGFWNGANGGATSYLPQPTSYDYDAPLTEAGDPWDKYTAIRDVIKKYNPVPASVPPATPKTAYGKVQADQYNTLSNSPNLITRSDGGDNPICMEVLTQAYGFINYTKSFQPPSGKTTANLSIMGLRDRAVIYIDDVKQGILERTQGNDVELSLSISFPSQTPSTGSVRLSIIVENMGRINYGSYLNDSKGILGTVALDGVPLTKDWLSQAIPLNDTEFYPLFIHIDTSKTSLLPDSTVFYHFTFSIGGTANDTYLDVNNWTKGIAIVNGYNIGRYWPGRGPQKTLYVPASVLKSNGANEVILFEIDSAPCSADFSKCTITFTTTPDIG